MTVWEKKIIDAFEEHYFASAPKSGEKRNALILRSVVFFPDFDSASSDEKESYLEAAESLERNGIIKLSWQKWNKGNKLKTLRCENFEKVFEIAGKPYPASEAEKIRALLGEKAKSQKEEKIAALLEYLSYNFGPKEIGQGIDASIMEDIVRLLEFISKPDQIDKITTRALSILLYRDSKHLENLLNLCKPLFSKVNAAALPAGETVHVPDISIFERSFPETMISGSIIIEYKDGETSLVNSGGHILGIPLENAEKISSIKPFRQDSEKTVLTIENKETFYALGSPQMLERKELSRNQKNILTYDCFLYAGGYSNRATAAIVKVLVSSGFSFYHAGDLDPDGILILQHIQDIAGKQVTPVRMDAETFDQYCAWGKPLAKNTLKQIGKIKDGTKAITELAGLIQRMEETALGVEQEIIDYRC